MDQERLHSTFCTPFNLTTKINDVTAKIEIFIFGSPTLRFINFRFIYSLPIVYIVYVQSFWFGVCPRQAFQVLKSKPVQDLMNKVTAMPLVIMKVKVMISKSRQITRQERGLVNRQISIFDLQ